MPEGRRLAHPPLSIGVSTLFIGVSTGQHQSIGGPCGYHISIHREGQREQALRSSSILSALFFGLIRKGDSTCLPRLTLTSHFDPISNNFLEVENQNPTVHARIRRRGASYVCEHSPSLILCCMTRVKPDKQAVPAFIHTYIVGLLAGWLAGITRQRNLRVILPILSFSPGPVCPTAAVDQGKEEPRPYNNNN